MFTPEKTSEKSGFTITDKIIVDFKSFLCNMTKNLIVFFKIFANLAASSIAFV